MAHTSMNILSDILVPRADDVLVDVCLTNNHESFSAAAAAVFAMQIPIQFWFFSSLLCHLLISLRFVIPFGLIGIEQNRLIFMFLLRSDEILLLSS